MGKITQIDFVDSRSSTPKPFEVINIFAKKNELSILISMQAIAYIIVLSTFNGTGDNGDSIMHYLYAKYSFQHNELFFNHWAKPFFVLLSSPFAQFGIIGIKVFNACLMLLCSILTYKTIKALEIVNPIVGPIMLVCSPLTFVLTFSGLTEPLFATLLIYTIYLLTSNRIKAGCIAASFLPFVRSEGMIIIGVILVYLVLRKEYKRMSWLMTGSIIYSLAGSFIYKDILWVFTHIPYAQLSSSYNNLYSNEGRLYHFFVQMNYVVGVPIYVLFWIGALSFLVKIKKIFFDYNLSFLVFVSFAAFFIAHTLFWFLGIFNSMGLKRVLISVAPLISIISLVGYNTLLSFFRNNLRLKKMFTTAIMGVVIIFPFTSNPAAINWKRDLNLNADQRLCQEVTSFIHEHALDDRRTFFMQPYLSETLAIDWFDSSIRKDLNVAGMNELQNGDIVIWDNWFSVVEGGVTESVLNENKYIKLLSTKSEFGAREVKFCIYEYVSNE
jgi:hypothetical protein